MFFKKRGEEGCVLKKKGEEGCVFFFFKKKGRRRVCFLKR